MDDEAVRRAYENHLAAAGFEVRTARTLPVALRRLSSSRLDAIVADVSLTSGGAEGLTLTERTRELFGPRPVVILLAYGAFAVPVHAASAARLDVDAFLHKPPSLVWLEGLLRAQIAARRGLGLRTLLSAG